MSELSPTAGLDLSTMPAAARPLLGQLSIAFSPAVFQRVLVLFVGAVLTPGRRTVAACLWGARALTGGRGESSSYRRVFSHATWSLWPLAKVLAAATLALIPPEQPVLIAGDDTVAQHRGKCVYGKGRHRDAVRSSHSYTVFKWGHKWVVLAIDLTLPFCSRPWALPVLAALYRPSDLNQKEGRRHKTPAQLARGLMAVLVRWFPERCFIFLGDGEYASHELACFFHRLRRRGRNVGRATLVSRFYPDAALYVPPLPPALGQKGRPRVKGVRLPSPQQVVAGTSPEYRQQATVGWYGGGERRVELVSCTGHWYQAGQGLVPLRWVFVHDLEGTHRDEYFFSTDPSLTPQRIVSLYTARWCIEVTFQEVRAWLGLETTRQWVEKSVLRAVPCLLGLFTVVSLIYARQVRRSGRKPKPRGASWYDKPEVTFSDALATVRRLLWSQTVLRHPPLGGGLEKLPRRSRLILLDYLSLSRAA